MGGKEVTVLAVEKEQEQECYACGPTAFWRSEIIKRGRRHMIPMISRMIRNNADKKHLIQMQSVTFGK